MEKLNWVNENWVSLRRVINQAADEVADLTETSGGLSKKVSDLYQRDRAQAEEITRLHAIVGVLATMVVERGLMDADSLVARVDAEIAELMPPKPAGPPSTECIRCSARVPIGYANLTAKGYVCEKCFLAAGG